MKSKLESRGPIINTEKCVANIGGRYDLVLIAAQRLREIKRVHRDNPTKYVTCVDALIEVQEGQVNVEDYILKIK
jgi:DNA-directed RNA polymerase subunit K/omega